MSLSERVSQLRRQSVETKPALSKERAELITDFYRKDTGFVSAPVRRALAFEYLLKHKEINIQPGELIVGERGNGPRQTPTYPELCCHSLKDLEVLSSREKIPFSVDEETKKAYRTRFIPFWKGKSIRDLIFSNVSPEWKAAYEHGVFTEFMEQRAPGHTVLGDKIYRAGFLDFREEIRSRIQSLNWLEDEEAFRKREELKAMDICAQALIHFAERYAQNARHLAQVQESPQGKKELERISEICEHVPARAPRDFWEALQYYWFVHLGVIIELNTWDSFNPGRLDQHLYPFYKKDMEKGDLSEERAKELLQCFWIKFNNQPAPPKVGVTAQESATYTDFALINTGGVKEDGSDGVNELTYLILDVAEEMRLVQPSTCLQLSKKNPDSFLKRGGRIVRTGFGQPSIFNHDVVIQELVRQGKSIVDARKGGTSGCVEAGAFGKENYNLTGYFNMPKVLEITLNNGVDPGTGRRLGPETGNPEGFGSFAELFEAYKKQLHYFVDVKVRGSNIIERLYAEYIPAPFMSILIDDCIASGKDYHNGGPGYNTSYIQGVGLGTITDALTSLKFHVFEKGDIPMKELLGALRENFKSTEALRLKLWNRTPKYGNDDDYADSVMKEVFEAYFRSVEGRKNTKGGEYHIDLLPTTVHVYFGSVTGALPDGRKARMPLSEGISPVQGADRQGPTSVFKSASKMDHIRTGGTLLNMKLTPKLMEGEAGLENFVHLVRSYFKLDGHHVQFNVVNARTLRSAQKEPEKYRDLIVRVAGYSDYFCDLHRDLQDEIIARTEQGT